LYVESLENRTLLSAATLVKDINRTTQDSFPSNAVVLGHTLIFSTSDGVHGNELWKSDGTAAGTVLVKDINPGSADAFDNGHFAQGVLDGTLYFTATDGVHGFELWKSDGTAAGTSLVQDIRSGPADSSPLDLTNFEGTLFFSADDGPHGRELWKLSPDSGAGTGPSSSPDNPVSDPAVAAFAPLPAGNPDAVVAAAPQSAQPDALVTGAASAGAQTGKMIPAESQPAPADEAVDLIFSDASNSWSHDRLLDDPLIG
jgi:ELWxxDGT repeat protein